MSLFSFLCGTYTVILPPRARRIYTGILIAKRIPIVKSVSDETGDLYVTLRTKPYRAFLEAVRARNLPPPAISSHKGFPVILRRITARPGMIAGMVLAAGIVMLSTLFCWRVDVICLDNAWAVRETDYIDVEDVCRRLSDMGVGVGLYLPDFNVRSAENAFLIQNDDISWMAINRRGSILSVEVRPSHAVTEHLDGGLRVLDDGCLEGANLVADTDGKIVRHAVENGYVVVSPEQMVLKGELLAAGILESVDGDVHYSRADGKVYAETVRQLRAEIPLKIVEHTATGETEKRYTCGFFRYNFPTFVLPNVTFLEIFQNWGKKTGFSGGKYDTIMEESQLMLPDGTPLPMTLTTETRLFQTERVRIRAKEEAMALAERELTRQLDGMTDARILSEETHIVWEEERLIVTRNLVCIDNIAKQQPFYIRVSPKGTTGAQITAGT